MLTDKVCTGFTLDVDVYKKLRSLKVENNTNLSAFVNRILKEKLEEMGVQNAEQ